MKNTSQDDFINYKEWMRLLTAARLLDISRQAMHLRYQQHLKDPKSELRFIVIDEVIHIHQSSVTALRSIIQYNKSEGHKPKN